MDEAYLRLLEALNDKKHRGGTADAPVRGVVISWPSPSRPGTSKQVMADGNIQDKDSLLIDSRFGPYDLAAGDAILLAPIEDRQRYIILCKVVAV